MAFRRGGKKGKEVIGGTVPANADGPARISNKLDSVLIAESKQASKLRKLMRHKRALASVLVVIVLLAGVAAGIWYVKQRNVTKQQGQDFPTLMASVKDLRNQGKDGEAQLQLIRFDKKYPSQTKEQRYRIANELAAIYLTSGDNKNALKWQQIALDNNPTPGYSDYLGLGEAYTLNGDNEQAIKYLQLALDTLKAEDPDGDGGPRGRFIQRQIDLLKKERKQ